MKKKRLDINESINDPEMIEHSRKLMKIGGTLKPEDYYKRFTI